MSATMGNILPLISDSIASCKKYSNERIRAFGHRNQAELTHSDTDFRKVTIYLPNALLQKMRQLKKEKIHSYSEAIRRTNSLPLISAPLP